MNAATQVSGRFGSMYQTLLVLKTNGAFAYVVEVDDETLRWGLYCNDAAVVSAQGGDVTDVHCLGKTFRLRCWRVAVDTIYSDTMDIADQLERESQKRTIQ